MSNSGSSPTLTDVTFDGNSASGDGGGTEAENGDLWFDIGKCRTFVGDAIFSIRNYDGIASAPDDRAILNNWSS